MNSYQKQKVKISKLEVENASLKKELASKGNVFFVENKYLGINQMVMGVVVDGEVVELQRNGI